jgi:hypothetical protein
MSRCAERGIDPVQLQRIGRLHGRPEWVAAGRFAQQYEQVMLLRPAVGMAAPQATVPALGAADLVGAAWTPGPRSRPAGGRTRPIGLLLVDDVQNLDPQAALLVQVLARGAGRHGPGRRSEPGGVRFPRRRCRRPARRAGRAPGCQPPRAPGGGAGGVRHGRAAARALPARSITGCQGDGGDVHAVLVASEHAEAAVVADTLRRAHLVDGVPWSQMAVIVRSVPRAGAGLPRALAAAGVPVAPPAMAAPLPDNAVVRALLGVLAAAWTVPPRSAPRTC